MVSPSISSPAPLSFDRRPDINKVGFGTQPKNDDTWCGPVDRWCNDDDVLEMVCNWTTSLCRRVIHIGVFVITEYVSQDIPSSISWRGVEDEKVKMLLMSDENSEPSVRFGHGGGAIRDLDRDVYRVWLSGGRSGHGLLYEVEHPFSLILFSVLFIGLSLAIHCTKNGGRTLCG